MRSEPLELSFAKAPVEVGSVTGTAARVRRGRRVARRRTASALDVGKLTGPVEEIRTGTKTSLAVVFQDGEPALVDFETDLHTNVPVEDGNQVSVVFVTGADGVNHLAVFVNHVERKSWFVGDGRQIAIELGAPRLNPWWAYVLRGLGIMLLIVSFVSAIAPESVERHFPSPFLPLAAACLAFAAGLLIPRRRFADAVSELKAGAESFAGRLLGS